MNPSHFIRSQADQCVKCGLCLPHCPTYINTRNENESPRGRIALIQALAEEKLPANPHVSEHLDNCLGCRSCEQICPSGVKYGQLIDASHALVAQQHPPAWYQRLALNMVTHASLLRGLSNLLRLYQRSGLQRLVRASGLLQLCRLAHLERLLPPLATPEKQQSYYPSQGSARGKLALFTGCIANVFDQTTLQDSIRVLNSLGYEVFVPPQQTCCGALHKHQGHAEQTMLLARQNLQAFSQQYYDAVIYTASGCGARLKEYAQHNWADAEQHQLRNLMPRIKEITQFLMEAKWPDSIKLKPLPKHVIVHEPCSMRNVLRLSEFPCRLLTRIPAIALSPLANNNQCCGAAGSYMITHPRLADALRDNKLEAIAQQQPDYVVTTNIGCALHLAGGLRQQGTHLEIIHPVSLVARQMK